MDESEIEKKVEYWLGEKGITSYPPKPNTLPFPDEREKVKEKVHEILTGSPLPPPARRSDGDGDGDGGTHNNSAEDVTKATKDRSSKILNDRASSSNNGGNMDTLASLEHQLSLLSQLKLDLETTRDDIEVRRQSYEDTIANLLAAGLIVEYYAYMEQNAFSLTNEAMSELHKRIQEWDLVVVSNVIEQIQGQIQFAQGNGA